MRIHLLLATVLMSSLGVAQSTQSTPVFSEPSFDPTGREIVFVSGGDIWGKRLHAD